MTTANGNGKMTGLIPAVGYLRRSTDKQEISLLQQVEWAVAAARQQGVALDDPGTWARQTLQRIRDWLGTGVGVPGVSAVQQRKSNLTRALEAAATQLAREWDDRLSEVLAGLM